MRGNEAASVTVARNRLKSVLRLEKLRNFDPDASPNSSDVDGDTECKCSACVSKDLGTESQNCFRYGKRQKLETTGHKSVFEPKERSYCLRLFDRSVDLSQFQESTPLYSICREWVKNKPTKGSRNREESTEKEAEKEEADYDMAQLPPPKPFQYRLDMYGKMISPRVPRPLPMIQDTESIWSYIKIHSTGDDYSLPSPAAIFQNHLNRWVSIRQRWKKACAENESRYEASFKALRKMRREIPSPPTQPHP